MPKDRPEVPPEIATEVLFASDSACCVCERQDYPIQIHHIDENPSNNAKENLAVLCTPCHDKTMIKGGFGRKLDASLVMQYRDAWVERVAARRKNADELCMLRMTGLKEGIPEAHAAVRFTKASGPSLIVTGIEKTAVSEVRDGFWTARPDLHGAGPREAEWLRENGQRALIVQFTNEGGIDSASAECLVKATLVFRKRDQETRRLTGCWLEGETDIARFLVDDSHGLLVGLISGGQIKTVAKRRIPTEFGSESILTDAELLTTNLQDCNVTIRLTNIDTGDFLVERKFGIDPQYINLVEL